MSLQLMHLVGGCFGIETHLYVDPLGDDASDDVDTKNYNGDDDSFINVVGNYKILMMII